MSNLLTRRLAVLADEKHRAVLGGGLRGIERETLRVDPAGHLARTPHLSLIHISEPTRPY